MDAVRPLFITPASAAKLLAISRSKLYSLLRTGEIPHRKIGSAIRIPIQALEAMAAEASKRVEN